ncbi:MAG TPA: xanthine dehydrogenase family protein subunit M [Stellaceae bacterium]|jgi:xanthine dehydrogenase YagS FAD-binding subunit|nr:xanthine dehydrogenase family protein subunit M [Stellaceae bacterium]
MEAFTLTAPTDLDSALATAGSGNAKFIAGGTDLMQLMKDFVERPQQLVDIQNLPLDRIEFGDNGARIGALVRMGDGADHPELRRRYPLIAEALLASASPQVRNMATFGGNLLQRTRCGYFRDVGSPCNKREPGTGCPAIAGDHRRLAILGGSDKCIATHPSDLAVALTALDAAVELRSAGGTRAVPITEFYRLPGDTPQSETAIASGELITAILLPPANEGERSHYLKVRDRAEFEFALVSAAVTITPDGDDRIRSARIAVGGVGTKPWRLPQVEAALAGAPASEEAIIAATAKAADGAHPLPENAFKVRLMQRALTRALLTALA